MSQEPTIQDNAFCPFPYTYIEGNNDATRRGKVGEQ